MPAQARGVVQECTVYGADGRHPDKLGANEIYLDARLRGHDTGVYLGVWDIHFFFSSPTLWERVGVRAY